MVSRALLVETRTRIYVAIIKYIRVGYVTKLGHNSRGDLSQVRCQYHGNQEQSEIWTNRLPYVPGVARLPSRASLGVEVPTPTFYRDDSSFRLPDSCFVVLPRH